MKLYQYAIIYTPKKEADKEVKKSLVLKTVTDVLAENDQQAMILAARAIPEDYLDKLDEVQVAVRPF